MTARSAIGWAVVMGMATLAAACADTTSAVGRDPQSRSTASMVTWSDGKPAISIQCDQPGGCQQRALAMCKGNNYTVLSMDNMPTRGDMTQVRGAASTVVRCN